MCPMCARVPAPVKCKDCGRLRHTFSLFTTFSLLLYFGRGFPVGSDDKEAACNAGEARLILGWGKTPWRRRKWKPNPVLLRGEPHGHKSLAGYKSMRSQKRQTPLSD